MRVHVMELRPGDRLTSDTFNAYGLHILSAATELGREDISKLFQHSIDYVDIADRIEIEAPTESVKVIEVYENSVTAVINMFEQAATEGKIDQEFVDASFEPLAYSFKSETDVVSLMLNLNSKDDYTYQHSVQVGMFSYYIAKWLGKSEKDAVLAGKAGFLHDIGKCKVSDVVLKKPGKLTPEEYAEVQKHTVYGYEIIKQSFGESPLALAALQHHERYDGKGYPNQLKSAAIHPLAKIVAVADIYSAMISSRVYQREKDLLFVLKELYRMSFEEIDPKITQVFIKNMIPNFIGKKVFLSNGDEGLIIMTNPTDFFRPLVQIGSEFKDLSIERELTIDKVLIN